MGEHGAGKFAGTPCPPNLCAETWVCMTDNKVHGPDARPRLEVEAPREPCSADRNVDRNVRATPTQVQGFNARSLVPGKPLHESTQRFGQDKDGKLQSLSCSNLWATRSADSWSQGPGQKAVE